MFPRFLVEAQRCNGQRGTAADGALSELAEATSTAEVSMNSISSTACQTSAFPELHESAEVVATYAT